jgi:predicted phosphoribosyltransferase
VAVPVGARETCDDLAAEADELVCLASPEPFYAVGLWYQNFLQTSDDEVRALLRQAETAASAPAPVTRTDPDRDL